MRWPLVLPVVALLGLSAGACGRAAQGTGSSARSASVAAATGGAASGTASSSRSGGYFIGDGDVDDRGQQSDIDDRGVRGFGHEASAAEVRAVASLIKRYYAAAVAGDSATACSLIHSSLARSSDFAKAVPSEYAPAPGSSALRGSCAQITSLLFKLDHQQLVADAATIRVTGVRVNGALGLALLGFRTTPERHILVKREGRAWKIDELLDSEMR
jgi:hypothetical protein